MSNKIPPISLIIPCYNEQLNLQKGTLDKIYHYIDDHRQVKEVIIVDDGSTDDTVTTIKNDYLDKYRQFRLIENHHFGKAETIITGIRAAKYDYVAFSDFDLATPIEELDKLIAAANQGAKVIIGSRHNLRSGAPIKRRLQSAGFNLVRDMIINLQGITDSQCGFKMFQHKTAIDIINKLLVFKQPKTISSSSVSACFDLEFLFIAKKMNIKIIEVPVIWRHVETKNVNFIKDSYETLRDILKIKYFDLKKYYD